MSFSLYSENPRQGEINTLHGSIHTPAFGPDATRGVIKNISPAEILESEYKSKTILDNKIRKTKNQTQFLLCNTYHLESFPSSEFIQKLGGLHQFIHWPLPILTDSGGFQVFSLIHGNPHLKGKVDNSGATFRNPFNGKILQLTPESAIDIQFNFGSDIMIVLDDHRHYQDNLELKNSVLRTIEWARRCKLRFTDQLKRKNLTLNDSPRPLLFGVIQGGIDRGLRQYCTQALIEIGFDGYAFGGWAISEKEFFPSEIMAYTASILPPDKPRYALGVGTPENIRECLKFGYDIFDCVIPSRNGRHGLCYTSQGEIRITNSKYKNDLSPLDPNLPSSAANYSKAFIHHLFKIKDTLGGELLTLHNLKYYNSIFTQI